MNNCEDWVDKGIVLFFSSVGWSDVQVREPRLIVQPTAARVAFRLSTGY